MVMKPVSTRLKAQLGESWVVPSEDEGDEHHTDKAATRSARKRTMAPADLGSQSISSTLAPAARKGMRKPAAEDAGPAIIPEASRPLRRKSQGASGEPDLVFPLVYPDRKDYNGPPIGTLGYQTSHPAKHNIYDSGNDGPWSNNISHQVDRKAIRSRLVVENGEDGGDQRNHLQDIFWEVCVPTLRYLGSIFTNAMRMLRTPLSYIIVTGAIFGIIVILQSVFTRTMATALSPLCSIPGSSYFNLPICAHHQSRPPVEFEQLMTVQSAFNDVLEQSLEGLGLPSDMKRSEASIRDLRHLVKFSNLPSRSELEFELSGFIDTARQASADLTHFNSRIGKAVDNILSTNRWTLQVIDGIEEREAARGLVSQLSDKIFAPFTGTPQHLAEDILLDQYLRHTSAVEDQISQLILEAQALLGILNNLDDRLDLIGSISTRDGVKAAENVEELFAHLWTQLGGNRSSVRKLNEQLALLNRVHSYRRAAWSHVTATVLKLQAIQAGLEDLRERVAGPETVGRGPNRDHPLAMHVQYIQMGVDGLQSMREESRKVEAEGYRKILERGGTRPCRRGG